MIRIVVGGQVEKAKIAQSIELIGGANVTVSVKGDIEGAMALKNREADVYIGACHTGGGAIAMPLALLGREVSVTVSSPGKPPKEEEIAAHVQSGKKVFGFAADHIDTVIPALMRQLLAQTKG